VAGQITVERKGYKRKAYTATRAGKKVKVSATTVEPASFKTMDRGARGRGTKVVPALKKESLGGKGFFEKSARERHAVEKRIARAQGERKVVGKLRAIQVFNKRVNPELSRKALADSKYIARSFEGKKEVRKAA
jgi:Family of unknown function (DUF5771)